MGISIGKIIGAALAQGLAGGADSALKEKQRQFSERQEMARAELAGQPKAAKEFAWFNSLPAEQRAQAAPFVMPYNAAAAQYDLPSPVKAGGGGRGRGGKKSGGKGRTVSLF